MNALLAAGAVVAAVLVAIALSSNRFASQRNLVSESWADVDTELRRRYDLIPNLVATVKGYAAHEQAVLEAVTAARAAAVGTTGPAAVQAPAEAHLVSSLHGLFAVAERYPDLKASDQFLALQRELANTEDRIQLARRIYNANVRDLNRRIESFPSNLVASSMHLERASYFEVEPALRNPPAVDLRPGPEGQSG